MLELSPYQFDDRLFFVGAALFFNWVIGQEQLLALLRIAAPGTYLTKLFKSLEQRLNRTTRSDKDRAVRGGIVLMVTLLLVGNVAMALSALTATHELGWLAEVAILVLFTPQLMLWLQGRAVYRALNKKDGLPEARDLLAKYTHRDTHNLDAHAIHRAMTEYIVSGFADQVLTPLFWFILLGLPGFVGAKIIRLAALLQGYDSKRHRAYGRLAGALHRILTWLPARLAGWLIVVAALFSPKGNPFRAMATLLKDSHKITPPLSGAPIAAAAGAIGYQLGGSRSVHGFLIKDPWIGSGSAKMPLTAFRKILFLYAIACLLILVVIATLLFTLSLS